MKVIVSGNSVEICGKNVGQEKSLRIYVDENTAGADEFRFELLDDCFRRGGLFPSIILDHNNVTTCQGGRKTLVQI
jgi:hypothetical protein